VLHPFEVQMRVSLREQRDLGDVFAQQSRLVFEVDSDERGLERVHIVRGHCGTGKGKETKSERQRDGQQGRARRWGRQDREGVDKKGRPEIMSSRERMWKYCFVVAKSFVARSMAVIQALSRSVRWLSVTS
jgi:hypothetical protein